MSNRAWLSEQVPALGAITAEGARNSLGRPDLSRLTVLVRESAQNSWDARSGDQPVRFRVDLRTIDGSLGSRWLEKLSTGDDLPGVPLGVELAASAPSVMFISDRGTTGLRGPTRADVAAEHGRHDYVSFVLNIGDPRDTPLGGGTYGYGKSSFFTTAKTRTVLAYTRCLNGGIAESRLIGMALGDAYEAGGTNFTGRHWWGDTEAGGIEPLVGDEADQLAAELGFPGFGDDQFGTTIAVVAPELGDQGMREAADWIAEVMLWHFWPRMTPRNGEPEMIFGVSVDGDELAVSKPGDHPAIARFSKALDTLDDDGSVLKCGSPKQDLGKINVLRSFEPPPRLSEVAAEAGMLDVVHHVCLLRAPRLVVQYLSGPPPLAAKVWYAGVFVALEELDHVFAGSEPPTHDAWVPTLLEGHDKTYVRTALRNIKQYLEGEAAPVEADAEGPIVPLGEASRLLAPLIGDVSGTGAGVGSGSTKGSSGSKGGKPRPAKLLGDPEWETFEGRPVLVQRVEVSTNATVNVEPVVAIGVWGGGAAESAPPVAGNAPKILGWRSGDVVRSEALTSFRPNDSGRWELLVEPVADTVTSVSLRVNRPGSEEE